MPTYITLFQWTQKGMENLKDSPKRLDKAKEVVKAAGGKIQAFYMTLGRYDGFVICEAPSDEACTKALLGLASDGAIKTETLRAFTEEESRKLMASLPLGACPIGLRDSAAGALRRPV
ncbi:MAG TPA: GYD domain-containing protein [Patescibacteria group bacterium]|nr:GYD domain-containing protein [Patescibacteria group bacterium]